MLTLKALTPETVVVTVPEVRGGVELSVNVTWHLILPPATFLVVPLSLIVDGTVSVELVPEFTKLVPPFP